MMIQKWFLAVLITVSGISGATLNNFVSAGTDCATVAEKFKRSDATTKKFQERPNTRGPSQGF